MNAGRLRHKITIERPTESISDGGVLSRSWSTFASGVFADVKTPSGSVHFSQNKFNSQVSHVVEIRWLSGVTPEMRVIFDSRILNIVYISTDRTNRRTLFLNCKEVVNG